MDGLSYTDFHDARKFLTEFVQISNTEFQPNWILKKVEITHKNP